jgi:hypothetical protein
MVETETDPLDDVTEKEILIEIYTALQDVRKDAYHLKVMVAFWFVLTLIGFLGVVIQAAQGG